LLRFFCLKVKKENKIGKAGEKKAAEREGENRRLGQKREKEEKEE
jgi:hypothetical protein